MPYDPNLQMQLNQQRLMHQRMAEHAAYVRRRRRGGRSGGGFFLLLLLVLAAAGAYVYVAHPDTWNTLVAHAESLVHHLQQTHRS